MSFSKKGTQFTALTAIIKMGDIEVGGLQSLTIDENWNMTRVGEIGTTVDVLHVPGRYQVNLTARRMFIESDLVMSALAPLGTRVVEEVVTPAVYVNDELVTPAEVKASTIDPTNTILRYDKIFHYSFTVAVCNESGVPVFTANDCSITSRRRTIDQGAIIVAEDVNIIAKSVTLGSATTALFSKLDPPA